MRKQGQAQDGDEPIEEYPTSEEGAAAVAVGCLAVVLMIGVVLGWLVRGVVGS